MFWDGTRWTDEAASSTRAWPRWRPASGLVATGIIAIALVASLVPISQASAASPPSGRSLIASWSRSYDTATVQESSRKIEYRGRWPRASHRGYLGHHVRYSKSRGATVKLTFNGTGVAWVGPTGPTRGKARVYLDGRRIKTVDTFSRVFRPSRVLFKRTFAKAGKHRLAIKVLGTSGRPTVAIDAIVIRKAAKATAPGPGVSGLYGVAINADTLANTQIGGTDNSGNTKVAYRFTPDHNGALAAIRVYFEIGSRYGGGNGGQRSVTIQSDAGGKPSGTVLARTTISGNTRFRRITFTNSATLTAGVRYHVVFVNTDASPRSNFVSANALYVWDSVSPDQPMYGDDWAVLIDHGGGWSQRSNYTPILQLDYSNGASDGIGYMEAWQRVQPAIGGTKKVRERFTVTGSNRTVTQVSVRLKRDGSAGSGALTVRLEDGSGNAIDEGTIPASAFPIGSQVDGSGNHNAWGTFRFSTTRTLVRGETYHLVLSAPSGTTFRAQPIREGVDYGFDPATYFADGTGQYDAGSGWRGFDQPGGSSNSDQGDLQFYFR
jgi:hypothetical protein